MGFPNNFSYSNFLKQYQQLVNKTAFPASSQAGTNSLPLANTGLPLNTLSSAALFQQMMMLQSAMTPQETSAFLKALLDLPDDIQTLLAQLATQDGGVTKKLLEQLLKENPDLNVSLERLQEMLGQKTQGSSNKMLQLMQANMAQSYTGDSQKMTELLKFTTQLSLRVNTSPMEALNTLILLYIPWYPLVDPQKLELQFESEWGEAEEGEEGESYTLVLYLETDTMGKFRIAAGVRHQTQLVFKIEYEKIAEPYIEAIQRFVTENLSRDGIPPPTFAFTESAASRKQAMTDPSVLEEQSGVDNFKTLQTDRKKLSISPSKGVSVVVLNAACQFSRIVFEVDERNRLLQRRKTTSD